MMPANKPAPEWFKVDNLPRTIALLWCGDHYLIRCGHCGGQVRHGLPVTPAWLRREARAFAESHLHAIREMSSGGLRLTCPDCGNEDQGRFRHVYDDYNDDRTAFETTYECLECETMFSDWLEAAGDDNE
jgi:hypothetical protein